MSVDFTKPIATADRAQNLTDTKDTLVAVAKQRPDLAVGGIAADMIRWSSGASKWEIFNGSAWVDLASTFAINVSSFGGQSASYYTNIVARLGYTPLDKAGGTMTGPLTLNAAPTVDLHASTKKYVDDGLATKAGTSHTHDWSVISSRLFAEGAITESAASFNYPVLLTNVDTPDSNYWFVTTLRRDVSNVAQTAVALAGDRMFMRSKNGGTWTPWVRCDLGEGLTRSIGASGYLKLPGAGGLILQWGRFTRTTGVQNVSFPMTFPNACLSVVQSDMSAAQVNDTSRTQAIYTSYFTSSRADASSFDVLYQAIGY